MPGCPACGSSEIRVSADAILDVELSWESGRDHSDFVEWGVPYNVDIGDARYFDCLACQHHEAVDGDLDLYARLGFDTQVEKQNG